MKQLVLSLLTVFSSLSYAQSAQTVIFVHGSWGGGWDYKNMQNILQKKGFEVYRPTLTGLGERAHLNGPLVNLDTHIMDIVNLVKYEDLTDVILVGHSYGGMVISGVAEKIPHKIKHLLYMDALLPIDGESVFDYLSDAEQKQYRELAANNKGQEWAIPPFWENWGKDVPHPIGTYEQAISINNPQAKTLPATYVLTIEPGKKTDDFAIFAQRAKARNWNYYELATGHNVQRTMPYEYAEIIEKIK